MFLSQKLTDVVLYHLQILIASIKNIISKINQEVDEILNDKRKLKKSDYSSKLVGQVKQEIQLSPKFIKKNLSNFISSNVKKYIKKCTSKDAKKISLRNLWVVRQFKNEYNNMWSR